MAKVIRGAIWSLCRGVAAHSSAPGQQAGACSSASSSAGRQLTQHRAESQLAKGGSEAYRGLRVLPEPHTGAQQRLPRAQQELHISTSSLVQVTFSGGGQTVVIRNASNGNNPVPPWVLGFLAGGGCTALGFAAYGLLPSSNQLSKLSNQQGQGWSWENVSLPWPFNVGTAKAASIVQPSGALPMPWMNELPDPQPAQPGSDSTASASTPLARSTYAEAAARAAPAVVHLVLSNDRDGSNGSSSSSSSSSGGLPRSLQSPFGLGRDNSGSGFIYDAGGYILTNAHVVAGAAQQQQQQQQQHANGTSSLTSSSLGSGRDGSSSASSSSASSNSASSGGSRDSSGGSSSGKDSSSRSSSSSNASAGTSSSGPRLSAHLQDGRVFEAVVVALDRLSDLAVVRILCDEPLPSVRLGSSQRLRVGEAVLALGSPLSLRHTVTAGIISCVERKGSELGIHSARTEYIQTDAAVNQGNSGGPLVNLDGEVVGINNMKALAADGVSFAIPIDSAKEVLAEMSSCGRVIRPFLGLTMAEIGGSRMRQLQQSCPTFPPHVARGIVVTRVTPGSPAATAGVQQDDVIVGFAGQKEADIASLAQRLKAHIGRPMELKIVRQVENGSYSTVAVNVSPVEAPAG